MVAAQKEVAARRTAALSVEAVIEYAASYGHLKGRTVLDVGCGPGIGAIHFRCLGYSVVGLDIDPSMLKAARDLGVECVRGDAQALPFKTASFDNVLSFHVIEHVSAPDTMVSEMRRTARGTIAIVTPNRDGPHRDSDSHVHEFGLEDLAAVLRDEFGDGCYTISPLRSYFYVSNDDAFVPKTLQSAARALFERNGPAGLFAAGFSDVSADLALRDPFWRAALRRVMRERSPGEGVTGNVVIRNYIADYSWPFRVDDEVVWVLVHKGHLERLTRSHVEAIFSAFEPVLANEVFVLFARPGRSETIVPGDEHYRSLVHKLVERGFTVESPPLYGVEGEEIAKPA